MTRVSRTKAAGLADSRTTQGVETPRGRALSARPVLAGVLFALLVALVALLGAPRAHAGAGGSTRARRPKS